MAIIFGHIPLKRRWIILDHTSRLLIIDENLLIGYQKVDFEIIFSIYMDYLCQKARLVSVGQVTEPLTTTNHDSVLLNENLRVALNLEALNNLEVNTADIQNSYITAPVTENIWTLLGVGFGKDSGKMELIVKA